MAWIYYKGKRRTIYDLLDNKASPKGFKNTTLYIKGDKPGTMYKLSGLRHPNIKEPDDIKKLNDSIFKARDIFLNQQKRGK